MTTNKVRQYWLNVLCGWAEDRLSPPQFDECCEVLGRMIPMSTADRLPPGNSDILWWYPKPPNVGWRLGWYASDKRYPLGCFITNESCWFLCDGPTWWMYPPPAPGGSDRAYIAEEIENVSTL